MINNAMIWQFNISKVLTTLRSYRINNKTLAWTSPVSSYIDHEPFSLPLRPSITYLQSPVHLNFLLKERNNKIYCCTLRSSISNLDSLMLNSTGKSVYAFGSHQQN